MRPVQRHRDNKHKRKKGSPCKKLDIKGRRKIRGMTRVGFGNETWLANEISRPSLNPNICLFYESEVLFFFLGYPYMSSLVSSVIFHANPAGRDIGTISKEIALYKECLIKFLLNATLILRTYNRAVESDSVFCVDCLQRVINSLIM